MDQDSTKEGTDVNPNILTAHRGEIKKLAHQVIKMLKNREYLEVPALSAHRIAHKATNKHFLSDYLLIEDH